MKKLPTVTIAASAYNEGGNIKNMLKSFMIQKLKNTMKKTARFQKPTDLQLFKGLVISIFQAIINGYTDAIIPTKIGKYRLVRATNKETTKGFGVGLYKYRGEKVFIKTWTGKLKNFAYYDLVNEYIASKIFVKKIESYNSRTRKNRIKIPKLIKYILAKDSLSLVFEYIEGETLDFLPLRKKVNILSKVIKAISGMSSTLTNTEKQQLISRGIGFYILSLPVFSIITIISNPKNINVVCKAFVNCLKALKFLKKSNLCVAHRDITMHNIIVNERGIFIIDWARMVLTVPGYDIAYLSLKLNQKLIADLVSQKLNYKPNPFLENYVLIHLANSYTNPKGYRNFFLKKLYEKYS